MGSEGTGLQLGCGGNCGSPTMERVRKGTLDHAGFDVPALRYRYWLTRVVFLRCLGFVYMVAFVVALNSNGALLGENGLLPAIRYMERLEGHLANQTTFQKVLKVPTIFWFVPPTASNLWWTAAVGAAVSAAISARGAANLPAMALLWALYHSLVNVGQTWYSFGWESQLLETGFLAMFLVPWLSLARFPVGCPTPLVCVWGYRWLLFRIMLGAGLIKLRGDACWQDLTCMDYHYETQPNPNPLSRYLHYLPSDWHKFEVVVNHVVELVLPWALLLGRWLRSFSGTVQILFQLALVMSGNLSFLNWLTAVPAVFSFDDFHLLWLFSPRTRSRVARLVAETEASAKAGTQIGEQTDKKTKRKQGDRMTIFGSGANGSGEEVDSYSGDGYTGGEGVSASEDAGDDHKRRGDGSDGISFFSGWVLRAGFWRKLPRWAANTLLAALILRGSIPVVKNMAGLGGGQVMNTSFGSLRLVNSYGAFGSVTKTRGEIVLKGTTHRDPYSGAAVWKEYEFKCKPGNVNQRPCIITPFHYRLDWQMWFAAFQNYGKNPWLVNLALKLLSRDDRDDGVSTKVLVRSLLRHDPFSYAVDDHPDGVDHVCSNVDGGGIAGEGDDRACLGYGEDGKGSTEMGPPLFIKADLYVYKYTPVSLWYSNPETTDTDANTSQGGDGGPISPPLRPGEERGTWWTRRFVREYMPPISLENESARNFLRYHDLA